MKRVTIIAALLLMGKLAMAGNGGWQNRYEIDSAIGPVFISSTAAAQPSITISTPTSTSARNCLTSLVVYSTNTFSPSIFSNATQIFGTGTTAANANFIKEWPIEDPICGAQGTQLIIKSTATAAGNTTMNFSYQGFVTR